MNKLAEGKRLLVLESDLHRSLISLERRNPRARLAGLRAARLTDFCPYEIVQRISVLRRIRGLK